MKASGHIGSLVGTIVANRIDMSSNTRTNVIARGVPFDPLDPRVAAVASPLQEGMDNFP